MKKILLFIVLAALCLNFGAHAQEKAPNKTALKIGDQVPDITINNIINYRGADGKPTATAKLSDFKGKLLILDFWDTYCSSCIEVLPKLDSLQKAFGDSISILPVTAQSEQSIKKFLSNNGYLKGYTIQTIVEDKILGRLFPHTMIPHDVWIDHNGKVCAITDAQYITTLNIRALLHGKSLDWAIKKDIVDYNEAKPLLNANLISGGTIYYSTITPFISGVPPAFGVKEDTIHSTIRTYVINFPILKMYLIAFGHLFAFPANHIVLEVKDKNNYIYDKSRGYAADWNQKHSYSYESNLPSTITDKERLRLMAQDMNKYLSLYGRMETRRLQCLILSLSKNDISLFQTKGEKHLNTLSETTGAKALRNARLSNLVWKMNDMPGTMPVVDETGYSGKVDMVFNVNSFDDVPQLRKELARYGLKLSQEERSLEVLVLSETGR